MLMTLLVIFTTSFAFINLLIYLWHIFLWLGLFLHLVFNFCVRNKSYLCITIIALYICLYIYLLQEATYFHLPLCSHVAFLSFNLKDSL